MKKGEQRSVGKNSYNTSGSIFDTIFYALKNILEKMVDLGLRDERFRVI